MLAYGRVGTVVEHNLFLDYRRQNAIHIKSLGNIVRYNSFIDQKRSNHVSKITVRSGQFNEVVANYMDGTTGLRIFEEHNRAIGNVLVGGAELAVMAGSGDETRFGGTQQRRAEGTFLAGNAGLAHDRLLPQPPREGARQEHGGGGAPGACRDGPGGGGGRACQHHRRGPKASPLTAAEVGLLAPTRAARRPDHRPGRTGPRAAPAISRASCRAATRQRRPKRQPWLRLATPDRPHPHRSARRLALLSGGTLLGQLLLVLVSPLLTRLYVPAEFGVLAVFMSLNGILGGIASLRYEHGVIAARDEADAVDMVWVT